jgi:hypothetical protein
MKFGCLYRHHAQTKFCRNQPEVERGSHTDINAHTHTYIHTQHGDLTGLIFFHKKVKQVSNSILNRYWEVGMQIMATTAISCMKPDLHVPCISS